MSQTPPRVLVVSGSDPLGYSGLQADLRHLVMLGLDPVGVPSCLTEQGRDGGVVVRALPADHVFRSLTLLVEDAETSVAKLGLLHRPEVVSAVGSALRVERTTVVLDPVLAAGSGESLTDEGMVEALLGLGDLVDVITPNVPELRRLTAHVDELAEGAHLERCRVLLDTGMKAVLLKGGHGEGDVVEDFLVTDAGVRAFRGPRITGADPRGTGCALASLIAGGLAVGWPLEKAVEHGTSSVRRAIARSLEWRGRRLILDEASRVWSPPS